MLRGYEAWLILNRGLLEASDDFRQAESTAAQALRIAAADADKQLQTDAVLALETLRNKLAQIGADEVMAEADGALNEAIDQAIAETLDFHAGRTNPANPEIPRRPQVYSHAIDAVIEEDYARDGLYYDGGPMHWSWYDGDEVHELRFFGLQPTNRSRLPDSFPDLHQVSADLERGLAERREFASYDLTMEGYYYADDTLSSFEAIGRLGDYYHEFVWTSIEVPLGGVEGLGASVAYSFTDTGKGADHTFGSRSAPKAQNYSPNEGDGDPGGTDTETSHPGGSRPGLPSANGPAGEGGGTSPPTNNGPVYGPALPPDHQLPRPAEKSVPIETLKLGGVDEPTYETTNNLGKFPLSEKEYWVYVGEQMALRIARVFLDDPTWPRDQDEEMAVQLLRDGFAKDLEHARAVIHEARRIAREVELAILAIDADLRDAIYEEERLIADLLAQANLLEEECYRVILLPGQELSPYAGTACVDYLHEAMTGKIKADPPFGNAPLFSGSFPNGLRPNRSAIDNFPVAQLVVDSGVVVVIASDLVASSGMEAAGAMTIRMDAQLAGRSASTLITRSVGRASTAAQREALLTIIRNAPTLAERKGIVYAVREMSKLGYELESAALHYRGRQGVDLVFRKGINFAVVEAKHGKYLSLLKTYQGELRQGSLGYNVSRLRRYLEFGDGTHDVLVRQLLNEARMGRLESYGTFYRWGRIYELPPGWPLVPAIPR